MTYPVLFVICCFLQSAAFAFQIPAFTSDLVDEAGVLNQDQAAALRQQILQMRASGDVYAAIFVVKSIKPLAIEEAANQVFAKWRLGREDADNGVLILAAIEDRQARIEVGYGLEPVFTDVDMFRVQAAVLTPAFKRGDYYGGLSAVLDQLRRLKLEGRDALDLPSQRIDSSRPTALPPSEPISAAEWRAYFNFVGIWLSPLILVFWPAYLYGKIKGRTDLLHRNYIVLGNGAGVVLSFLGAFVALTPEALPTHGSLILLLYTLSCGRPLLGHVPTFLSQKRYRRARARIRWNKIYYRAYGERVIFGRKYVVVAPTPYSPSRGSSSSSSSHSSSSSRSGGGSSSGGSSGGGGASSRW